MRYYTHMAIGGALGFAAARLAGLPEIYMVPAAALGAAVPDIDHPASWISTRVPLWPWLLELIQKRTAGAGQGKGVLSHRGMVHSLYGAAVWAAFTSAFILMFFPAYWPVLVALNLGFLCHLYLADIFCDGGVHLLKKNRRVKIPAHGTLVATGSAREILAGGLVCAALLALAYIPSLLRGFDARPYLNNLPVVVTVAALALTLALTSERLRARQVRAVRMKTFAVEMPRDDESTLEAATNLFQALHGLRAPWYRRLLVPQAHIVAEIVGSTDISFHITVPDEREIPARVKNIFHSWWPNIRLLERDEFTVDLGRKTAMAQLKQVRHSVFALKSTEFEEGKDPIEAVTNALSGTPAGEVRMIQYVIKPTGTAWQHKARQVRNRVREKGSLNVTTRPLLWLISEVLHACADLASEVMAPSDRAEDRSQMMSSSMIAEEIKEFDKEADAKLQRACFRTEIRLLVQSEAAKYDHVEALADAYRIYDGMNRLKKNRVWPWSRYLFLSLARDRNYPLWGSRTILDAQELGLLFHPPCQTVETRGLRRTLQREKETSVYIPEAGRLIGIAVDRGSERYAALGHIDERLHCCAIGKTGLGKTEQIKAMIEEGLATGGGIYLDPHGEAAKQLMGQISDKYLDRVLYWAPWDEDTAIGFNPIEKTEGATVTEKNLIVGNTIDVFESSWQMTEVMVRLKHYLRYGLQTLIEYPGCGRDNMTILELEPLFVDKSFRNRLLTHISSPVIRSFWADQYDKLQERQRFDHITPLLDRLTTISLDTRMKHTLGQSKSQIDWIDLMDSGKFLVIDLDMGKLGRENTRLLGTLVVSKLFQAAMARKRRDLIFRMYIDEAENFMTYTYALILSQSRKFGLCQYLFVQFLDQLPEEVLLAVLGNVGTLMCLRSGINDAKLLAPYFTRTQLPEEVNKTIEDMLNLEPYTWLVKTSAEKNSIPSFKMKSLPMLDTYDDIQAEFLLRSMFSLHCKGVKTRDQIEEEIIARRGQGETANRAGGQAAPGGNGKAAADQHSPTAGGGGQGAKDASSGKRLQGHINGPDHNPRNKV